MKPSLRLTGQQFKELQYRLAAGESPRLLYGERKRDGASIYTVRGFGADNDTGIVCGTSTTTPSANATGWLRLEKDGSLSGGIFHDGSVPFVRIAVAGDELLFWDEESTDRHQLAANTRNVQAFGEGTIRRLGGLSIAVIGCSGLGFPVAQALAGQGAGRLVLVDPETIEDVNLNRLPCATKRDIGMLKVECLARLLAESAFEPEVVPLATSILTDRQTALEIAECDVIFGCLDSVEARHFLNRLAATYCIPYFDLGVCLRSDGKGGVSSVCGSVHYVQPDGSSLHSRGVYDMQGVQDEGIRRTDPAEFAKRQAEKYVRGVQEKRPAVMPLNMTIAGLAVMEFMARLHPFRTQPNANFAAQCVAFEHGIIDRDPEGKACPLFSPLCGCGDMEPFLGLPSFPA
jgi:hypothetical protein